MKTYLHSFDPAAAKIYQSDKGKNIWFIDSFIYIVNGFINDSNRRTNEIFVLNGIDRNIVNHLVLVGPQNDIVIRSGGGYFISENQEVFIVGEWYDYIQMNMRVYLGKLDKYLNIKWIKYYNDISDYDVYGYAVTETHDGNILFSMTDHISDDPFLIDLRVVKTDSVGNVIWNKIIPDTFATMGSYGDLTRTDDGYYILTASTVDFHHNIGKPYNSIVHKFDDDGEVIWSRLMKFSRQFGQAGVNTTLPGGDAVVAFRGDTSWYDWITVDDEFPAMYRLDANGAEKWRYKWYEPAVHYIYRIITARNGDILGLGIFQGTGKAKTWLFRVSPDGELLWERHYSDSIQRPWSPQLEMLDLCEMDDGRIAATGIVFDTNSFGDINLNIGLLVVDSLGCIEPDCSGRVQYTTSVEDLSILKTNELLQLKCSPNPVKDVVSVTWSETIGVTHGKLEIRCFDQQGILVNRFNLEGGLLSHTIETGNMPQGHYRLLLYENGMPLATGSFVIIR